MISYTGETMKNIKKLTAGFVLSIGLLLSGVALAQNPTPSDQKKDAESCCAMASCCCKGGSCSMIDHAKKDHAKEHADKDHSKEGGCCCCKGDSCKMEMKDKKGN
jgi:hypothetical protein